jgi:hypothetical protein
VSHATGVNDDPPRCVGLAQAIVRATDPQVRGMGLHDLQDDERCNFHQFDVAASQGSPKGESMTRSARREREGKERPVSRERKRFNRWYNIGAGQYIRHGESLEDFVWRAWQAGSRLPAERTGEKP